MDTAVEEIRERVEDDYRAIPQPDHSAMLADLKTLIRELDSATERAENAEGDLDEIIGCDKCDLCEDHH